MVRMLVAFCLGERALSYLWQIRLSRKNVNSFPAGQWNRAAHNWTALSFADCTRRPIERPLRLDFEVSRPNKYGNRPSPVSEMSFAYPLVKGVTRETRGLSALRTSDPIGETHLSARICLFGSPAVCRQTKLKGLGSKSKSSSFAFRLSYFDRPVALRHCLATVLPLSEAD